MAKPREISDYRRAIVTGVFCHALHHRRAAGRVVALLLDNVALASRFGKTPYLTHCNLAVRRGVQHRNTTRDQLNELAKMGLVKVWSYRPGYGIRFVILWAAVGVYARDHGIKPMHAAENAPTARTVADFDAEREAFKARREKERLEKIESDRRASEAEKARMAAEAASPEGLSARAAFFQRARELKAMNTPASRPARSQAPP